MRQVKDTEVNGSNATYIQRETPNIQNLQTNWSALVQYFLVKLALFQRIRSVWCQAVTGACVTTISNNLCVAELCPQRLLRKCVVQVLCLAGRSAVMHVYAGLNHSCVFFLIMWYKLSILHWRDIGHSHPTQASQSWSYSALIKQRTQTAACMFTATCAVDVRHICSKSIWLCIRVQRGSWCRSRDAHALPRLIGARFQHHRDWIAPQTIELQWSSRIKHRFTSVRRLAEILLTHSHTKQESESRASAAAPSGAKLSCSRQQQRRLI